MHSLLSCLVPGIVVVRADSQHLNFCSLLDRWCGRCGSIPLRAALLTTPAVANCRERCRCDAGTVSLLVATSLSSSGSQFGPTGFRVDSRLCIFLFVGLGGGQDEPGKICKVWLGTFNAATAPGHVTHAANIVTWPNSACFVASQSQQSEPFLCVLVAGAHDR